MKSLSIFPSMKNKVVLFLGFTLAAMTSPSHAQKKTKVVGFYPVEGSAPLLQPEQFSRLSHIIVFSLTVAADGTLLHENVGELYPLNNAIENKPLYGYKVLVAVGGSGKSQHLSSAVSSANRETLVKTLTKYAVDSEIDGLDIDWEFPGSGDAANFTAFMTELKASLSAQGKMLTMDVQGSHQVQVVGNNIQGWEGQNGYYPKAALQQCDFINIMAYDDGYAGGETHSTLDHAKIALKTYTDFLGSGEKLVLGLPFYGKLNLTGPNKSYKELAKEFAGNIGTGDLVGGYNFNGPTTIQNKTEYAITNGNAGVMIWDLNQDAEDFRLLKAISAGLKAKGATLDAIPSLSVFRAPSAGKSSRISISNGSFQLYDLVPGSYTLTLSNLDGRKVMNPIKSDKFGNSIRWDLPSLPLGAYTYKVEGQSGSISSGIAITK